MHVSGVEEQNLPPQNVSLAYGLLQAENNEGLKNSGRNFELPPNCLKKNLGRKPVPKQSHLQRYPQRIWAICGGENSVEIRSPLCPIVSPWPGQAFIYQIFAFFISKSIAFLPSQVSNHYPQHLLSLAEGGIKVY